MTSFADRPAHATARHLPGTRQTEGVDQRVIPASSPADILLVDDSMCCQQSIGFALRRAGHQVREASSADAALRELERTGPPKVCIVDHIMADLDGACLIHILRQRADTAHTAMVLMCPPPRPTSARTGARSRAHAWLAKPFAPEQLLAIISILLDR